MNNFTLPDLRFEQTFMKSLYGYSGQSKKEPNPSTHSYLTDEELNLLNEEADAEEIDIRDNAITPSIIAYAIVKDQIIIPLIQGFLWTGFLISVAPVLRIIVRNGQVAGRRFYNLVGLGNLTSFNRRRAY